MNVLQNVPSTTPEYMWEVHRLSFIFWLDLEIFCEAFYIWLEK